MSTIDTPAGTPALLTFHDAAHLLGCSLSTVKSAARCGDLEVVRIGRLVRVRPAALDAYIDARTVPATSARARVAR